MIIVCVHVCAFVPLHVQTAENKQCSDKQTHVHTLLSAKCRLRQCHCLRHNLEGHLIYVEAADTKQVCGVLVDPKKESYKKPKF